MPVSTARVPGSPACNVNGGSASGPCSSVCPWLPMARTAAASYPLSASSCLTAAANSWAIRTCIRPKSARFMLPGRAAAACSSRRRAGRIGTAAGGFNPQAVIVHVRQHGINAVHTGARNQADIVGQRASGASSVARLLCLCHDYFGLPVKLSDQVFGHCSELGKIGRINGIGVGQFTVRRVRCTPLVRYS